MSKRATYVLAFFGTAVASMASAYVLKNIWLGLFLCFVAHFIVNFWYGKSIQTPPISRVFASIFACPGFAYLMGYDTRLIGAWELLQKSVKSYEANFKKISFYPLALILVSAIIATIISLLVGILSTFSNAWVTLIVLILLILIGIIAIITTSILIMGAMYFAIRQMIDGAPIAGFWANIKTTRSLFWRYLGSQLLALIYTTGPLLVGVMGFIAYNFVPYFLGSLDLGNMGSNLINGFLSLNLWNFIFLLISLYGIIHATYFSIRIVFSQQAVLFENKKPVESITRSLEITHAKWWPVLWRIAVPGIIVGLISSIVSGTIDSLQFFTENSLGLLLGVIINLIVQIAIVPIIPISIVKLYDETKKI